MNDLFGPNNHSKWEVLWSDTDNEQAQLVRELLQSHYAWDEILEIKKSGAWEVQSKNFRVTVLENGSPLTVLVKKNPSSHTPGRLELVEHTLSYLLERGLPVPEILPTKDGSKHVTYVGTNWQVFSFLPGNYFRGTEGQLAETAKWVARLHTALNEASFIEQARVYGKAGKPWSTEIFQNIFASALEKTDELSRQLVAEKPIIEDMMKDVEARKKSVSVARRQVVRNSLHPHDTLFVDDKLQAIIDFEEIGEGELLRDVGGACHRFVRQFVVHQAKPWDETLSEGVKIFLESYVRENPLSRDELDLLPIFIKDELLRKLASACLKIPSQEKPGTYEAEALKFINLLKESKVIGERIVTLSI